LSTPSPEVDPDAALVAWQQREAEAVIPTYRRFPVAFTHGEGARLYDLTGKTYIDFSGGIAVSALGHGHPELIDAIRGQAERLLHVSNLYVIPEQVALAEQLSAWLGYARFFFCNSGAEANEALIKLARAWGRPRGRRRIVVAAHGFHGRTMGALSATPNRDFQAPFAPLLDGFDVVPFGDIDALAAALGDDSAAVLLEPLQAESGGALPPDDYFPRVRELCDRHGCLWLADEVQTGVGRLGVPLATHLWPARPDAVSLAKGLGGGVPIGAIGVDTALADVLQPGMHGTTFGGNPLACRAAQVVVATLSAPGVLTRVEALGRHVRTRLEAMGARDVRGRGLFWLLTVDDPLDCARRALAQGLLVVPAKRQGLRLLPPLTIDQATLDAGLDRLAEVLV